MNAMRAPDPPRKGIRFDTGNMLAVCGFATSLIIWGVRLEGRVDQEIALRSALEQRLAREHDADQLNLSALRVAVDHLDGKITTLLLRIGSGPFPSTSRGAP